MAAIQPVHGAGLTIITHGLNTDTPRWISGMSDAVSRRVPGAIICTLLVTGTGPGGSVVATPVIPFGARPLTSSNCELIVLLDWSALSAIDATSTKTIAEVIVPKLFSTDFFPQILFGRPLAELPIHLIGHSRGGTLVCEMAKYLGQQGIWVNQITTLDPRGVPALDATVAIYESVLFADNYWEADSGIFDDIVPFEIDGDDVIMGQHVDGAYNRFLAESLVSQGGYASSVFDQLFAEHSNVHLWYHGTVDTSSPTSDGDGGIITATMRNNWYRPDEDMGKKAGFYYSRLGNGAWALNGFPFGYNDGNHYFLSDKRINVDRNPSEWPSLITFINNADGVVQVGGALPIHCVFQSYDSSCSITTFLDRDQNPYNGNEVALAVSPPSFDATDRLTKVVDVNATVSSGTPSGVYYVYGKIKNPYGSRYLYADTQVFIQSTPNVALNIESILPRSLTVSKQSQRLTITGTGFTSGSTLLFNGQTTSNPVQLHYVNSTEIQYDIVVLSAGEWTVQVINDGTKSLPSTFYVLSGGGAKQLTGLSISGPATVSENSTANIPFTAKAIYSDGSSPNVTPVWNVIGGPVNTIVTTSGQFNAGSVNGNTTVTVTASYTDGSVTKTASMAVTILKVGITLTQTTNVIVNGDFAAGISGWVPMGAFQADSRFLRFHYGPGYAYLANSDGSPGNSLIGTLSQTFTIPPNAVEVALDYWHLTSSQETASHVDRLNVSLRLTNGSLVGLDDIWNSNDSAYVHSSYDLMAYKGQKITLIFTGTTSASLPTTFRIDDVSVTVTLEPPPTPVSLGIRGPNSLLERSAAQYDVVVVYSDGSFKSPTSSNWTISGSGAATISPSGPSATLTAGSVSSDTTATITVSCSELNTNLRLDYTVTILNVADPAFAFLEIDGPNSINENSSAQFTATAIFDDSSRRALSPISWLVTPPATIANSGVLSVGEVPSDRIVTVLGTGILNGITRTGSLSVLLVNVPPQRTLVSLNIIGPSTINQNTNAQFVAVVTFSDGSSQAIVPSWANDSLAVSISNSGLLSAGEVSSDTSVTISATYPSGGITLNASKTVTIVHSTVTIPTQERQLTEMKIKGGLFQFLLNGPVGNTYIVQVSTNLPTWLPLTTNTIPASGSTSIVDSNGSGPSRRFYRAVQFALPSPPPDLVGMAYIPAGSFTMGNALVNDPDLSAELPTHTVTVGAFYMDKYHVTKALWDEVYQWGTNHGYAFDNPGLGKGTSHPVHTINWYDIVKWCNARSEKEGRTWAYYIDGAQTVVYRKGQVDVQNGWVKWNMGYRLPTEAEWEKAARGGLSGKRFPWGDTITHSQANYFSVASYTYDISSTRGFHPNYQIGGQPFTNPVGSFAANDYGLYDMAGNVYQWCWDWSGTYGSASQIDPLGPLSGGSRLFRGGVWSNPPDNCRVAYRGTQNPTNGDHTRGFRCVLLPGQP